MAAEERTGTITAFYDGDTGSIKDSVENIDYDFAHPGAEVDFIIGRSYYYLRIATPKGKIIIKELGRPV